ncbi:MAG: NAD-dependent epimerase/dehydratase family protein [Pirellulales bacterium]
MTGRAIVVTGAGGFLGGHLLPVLAAGGARISALCKDSAELPGVQPLVRNAVAGDILDAGLLESQMAGADTVIHLAGPPFVAESFRQPLEYARVHVLGTVAVAEACLRLGVRRLVYVSSAEVYGRGGPQPVREDQPPSPRSPYGAAKLSAERFIATLLAQRAASAVVLRPFSVYGPGAPAAALVPTIVGQALAAPQIELANLLPVRDYCYVGDLAQAIVRATEADVNGIHTVNIGSGQGISVRALAEQVLKVIGRDVPIVHKTCGDRPAEADVDCLVAAVGQAHALLSWRAETTLASGLARVVEQRRTEMKRGEER